MSTMERIEALHVLGELLTSGSFENDNDIKEITAQL